ATGWPRQDSELDKTELAKNRPLFMRARRVVVQLSKSERLVAVNILICSTRPAPSPACLRARSKNLVLAPRTQSGEFGVEPGKAGSQIGRILGLIFCTRFS